MKNAILFGWKSIAFWFESNFYNVKKSASFHGADKSPPLEGVGGGLRIPDF
jgi:hypothetical protein